MAEKNVIRCAIYTRKSSEYGLEQDFNSLDAQREACEAYIKSQSHEGWQLLPAHYDDGGISGATLERPAIQKLLADVKEGKVDVIVVYKVDRLTRSLADFAKLVELFTAHSASFVSVTQQFNTTNSMGRLTLNVLLSFAQFEREVTAERIRDKIAASKKKGMWLGGVVPLGYVVKDKKLIVDETEAALVRLIFRRYLEMPTIKALAQDLEVNGHRTRTRTLSNGKIIGGIPFGEGPLAVLLKNRIYIGEVTHADKVYPGLHQAIITKDLFDAVQAKLASKAKKKVDYTKSDASLTGLIYDDAGSRMVPVHTRKGSLRYRYYVSATVCHEEPGIPGSAPRVSAPRVEAAVASAICEHLQQVPPVALARGITGSMLQADCHQVPISNAGSHAVTQIPPPLDLIAEHVERVVVSKQGLAITLKVSPLFAQAYNTIQVPLYVRGRTAHRQIIPARGNHPNQRRTLKLERRVTLLTAIAQARRWADELTTGRATDISALADHEGISERNIRRALPLAFLAPDIIQAAIDGDLPPDLVMTRICVDLPVSWAKQRKALALR